MLAQPIQKELLYCHVKMATNMCKINKKLHFIENLTNDFEKTLDPPVDLLDASLVHLWMVDSFN
jgi:hypothetical protein